MRHSVTMMETVAHGSRDAVNRLLRDLGDKNDTLTEEKYLCWVMVRIAQRKQAMGRPRCRSKRMSWRGRILFLIKFSSASPEITTNSAHPAAPLTDSNVVVFNTPMAGKNDMSQSPPVTRRLLRLTMPFDGSLRVDCRGTDAVSQPYITLFEEDSVTSLGTGDEDPTVTYSNMRLEIPRCEKDDT